MHALLFLESPGPGAFTSTPQQATPSTAPSSTTASPWHLKPKCPTLWPQHPSLFAVSPQPHSQYICSSNSWGHPACRSPSPLVPQPVFGYKTAFPSTQQLTWPLIPRHLPHKLCLDQPTAALSPASYGGETCRLPDGRPCSSSHSMQ